MELSHSLALQNELVHLDVRGKLRENDEGKGVGHLTFPNCFLPFVKQKVTRKCILKQLIHQLFLAFYKAKGYQKMYIKAVESPDVIDSTLNLAPAVC